MAEEPWSTCAKCNTLHHTTATHPQDPVPDSLQGQPDPAPGSQRQVLPLVLDDYRARMEYYAKPEHYGQPLCIDNMRDHLRDAYHEALDQTGYLKAAMVLWDEMHATMQAIAEISHPQGVRGYPGMGFVATDALDRLQKIQDLVAPYLPQE